MDTPLTATNPISHPTRRHGDVEHLIQATDKCSVCGDSAGELASRLNRFNLPIQMTLASVFAERDLCAACCNDLGRAMWAETKRGLSRRTLAEQDIKAGGASDE